MEGHHHQQPSSLEDRPSFSSWRKNEEATKAKSLTFIQTDPGQLRRKASTATQSASAEPGHQQHRQPASPPTSSISSTSSSPRSNDENGSGNSNSSNNSKNTTTATDKRRAQVRRAQLQHRARKAEYVRQLEADIEAMRARIEGAERDRQALQEANEGFRARIRVAGGGGGVDGGLGLGLPLPDGAVVSADDDVLRQQQEQLWTGGFDVGGVGGRGDNGGGGFPGLGDGDAIADAGGRGLGDLSFYTGSAPDPRTVVMSASPLFGSPSPACHQYSSGGHLEQLLFAYNSTSNSGHGNTSGDSTPYLDLMLPEMGMNDIYTASSSSYSSHKGQAGRGLGLGQGQVMVDLSLYP